MNYDIKQHRRSCIKVIVLFSIGVGTILIVEAGLMAILIAILQQIGENSIWTEERIAQSLGLSIPEEATNVRFDGAWQSYARHLTLDFEAPPSILANFASHFCNGALHSGYDPFNDIEVAKSIDSPYTVMIEHIYNYRVPPVITWFYAYSPITSENIFGNECISFDETGDITGSVELIVDKSNVRNHQIHLEYYGHSYTHRRFVSEMDVQPVENFPIVLRGLLHEGGDRYLLHWARLCIEIDPLSYFSNDEDWRWLVGSNIQIAIDGNDLPEAYISAQGLLTPRYDQQGAPFVENDRYFNYCYIEDWSECEHELQIEMRGTAGQHTSLTWDFYAD